MKDILSKEWLNHVETIDTADEIVREISKVAYYAGASVMIKSMTQHGIMNTVAGGELMADFLKEIDNLYGDFK